MSRVGLAVGPGRSIGVIDACLDISTLGFNDLIQIKGLYLAAHSKSRDAGTTGWVSRHMVPAPLLSNVVLQMLAKLQMLASEAAILETFPVDGLEPVLESKAMFGTVRVNRARILGLGFVHDLGGWAI